MAEDLAALERRALELIKTQNFGPEAVAVNAAILERAPKQVGAWTRLGRCHLEQGRFDEAVEALRSALAINPAHAVATNLLNEVRKRRAQTPTAAERATTGFTAREFALLSSLSTTEAVAALQPRTDALFDALNASSLAPKIVAARHREGQSGQKLYHAGSAHGGNTGHIDAYHHGGRWEPQFNIGWFGATSEWSGNAVRVGLGFNASFAGRDADRADGPERVLRYFERFQQAVARSWKNEIARWMTANSGFIQLGARPPALDLLPERAVERLLAVNNLSAQGWAFVGRWLFLDRSDDAAILRDRARLARTADDVFRALFPIWSATYASSSGPV